MADRGTHPLHLVLPPLVDGQLETRGAQPAGAGRGCPSVFQLDAFAEAPDRLPAGVALDLHLVDLVDAVARVGEPVSERPVVREQERSGRIGVEAADRDDAKLVTRSS
jgi:hypothetical protein